MPRTQAPAIQLKRRTVISSAVGMAVFGLAGCGSSANGAGDSAAASSASTTSGSATLLASSVAGTTQVDNTTATARVFAHPGLLHTEADFTRMRDKVATQAQPWLAGWNALTANGRSQLGATPRPLATVYRGTTNNSAQMYIDIDRAYQLALRWKVSGDTRFADLAVVFLNAWSSTLTSIQGNADRYLAAGIYGYQFANAAEIMRTYSGWAAADFAQFQNMMLTVFYPLSSWFLVNHNDAVITNYWANWDQCALACVLSVGVLCDREDIYNEAMAYYRSGAGNGAGLQAVYHVHPGYLGQWQESGRDQGHCTLGIGLAGAFCEMAWNQGDDIYGYDNNRYLAGAEYVAKSNLLDANGVFNTVPWLTYADKQGVFTGLSAAAQGHRRPVWEMPLHHYQGRRGIAAKYVGQEALQLRPETDGGNGDQLGFGTLTFARDPLTGAAPQGLTVRQQGTQAVLSWWGTPDATSYNVKRASSAGGSYATVASGITDLLTWTDTLPAGTSWYVVTAVSASGESAVSNAVSVSLSPVLSLQLKFNEASGTAAADSTAQWPAATLTNGAAWAAGHEGSACALDGVDDYVALPAGIVDTLSDFTMATWVYLGSAATWARLFDFGSGPRRCMFLTVRNGAGVPRFCIDTIHGYNAQVIDGNTAFPVGSWVHVAVTLSAGVGTLYLNGAVVGSNTDMKLAPYHLGAGMDGWIGRSQYAADPYLKAKVDDFRVYQGALTAADIAALASA